MTGMEHLQNEMKSVSELLCYVLCYLATSLIGQTLECVYHICCNISEIDLFSGLDLACVVGRNGSTCNLICF